MRGRLGAALLGFVLVGGFGGPAAQAQAPPSDSQAYGDLIPGGAGVGANYSKFVPGSQGNPSPSGGNPNITCVRSGGRGAGTTSSGWSKDELESDYQEALLNGQDLLSYGFSCFNEMNGQTTFGQGSYPPQPGQPLIDPIVVRDIAYSQLYPPPPTGEMTPSLATGTVAQLLSYFVVDNWGPVDSTATAGPVTATVTATPRSQTWAISDSLRNTTYSVTCQGPGVPFDGSDAVAPPGACTWTPPHSSAGQMATHPDSGQPCFTATVMITWDVSWTSNVGAGGGLGTLESAASACIVVHEIQAVVTDG